MFQKIVLDVSLMNGKKDRILKRIMLRLINILKRTFPVGDNSSIDSLFITGIFNMV